MNYSCSLKCLSLATATLLLNSYKTQADVRGNLDNANTAFRALTDNPGNWKEVAQSFVNVFDEFSNGIFTVLDEHGGKFDQPFISISLWKQGKLLPEYCCFSMFASKYLKQETIDAMPTCGPSFWHESCWGTEETCFCMFNPITTLIMTQLTCCLFAPWFQCAIIGASAWAEGTGTKGNPIYYFKDNVEGPVKTYISQALRVSSIKQAGLLWERNFVTPVSQLLIEHSEEMKQDAVTLQILLNLRKCYSCCDFQSIEALPNSNDITQMFFESLAETIITCNTPGEMENILCGLLLKNDGKSKIGNKYYKGCGEYNIPIKCLIQRICEHVAISKDSTQTNETIQRAIQVAMSIVKEMDIKEQREHEQYVADQYAYAAEQVHYSGRY